MGRAGEEKTSEWFYEKVYAAVRLHQPSWNIVVQSVSDDSNSWIPCGLWSVVSVGSYLGPCLLMFLALIERWSCILKNNLWKYF